MSMESNEDLQTSAIVAIQEHDIHALRRFLGPEYNIYINALCPVYSSGPYGPAVATLLHWSAYYQKAQAFSLLMEAGANPNVLTPRRETVLEWSLRGSMGKFGDMKMNQGKHFEPAIALQLLRTTDLSKLPEKEVSGGTPAPAARERKKKHVPTIDPSWPSRTPLIHICIQERRRDVLHALLLCGAHLHGCDEYGRGTVSSAILAKSARMFALCSTRNVAMDRPDQYGCTPMHYAALMGTGNIVKSLLEETQADLLWVENGNGKTPAELAASRGHEKIKRSLMKFAKRRRGQMCPKKSKTQKQAYRQRSSILQDKRPYMHITEIYFLVTFAIKIITHTIYVMPTVLVQRAGLIWLFWTASLVIVALKLYFSSTDPGRLPAQRLTHLDAESRFELITRVMQGADVCLSCNIVKPYRSKHCNVCDRCVCVMDHHCPWVNNCVGRDNHLLFVILLMTMFTACITHAYSTALFIAWNSSELGWIDMIQEHKLLMITAFHSFGVFMMVFGLFVKQTMYITMGLTTNEFLTLGRRKYMHDNRGQYKNPYDYGQIGNILHFCGISEWLYHNTFVKTIFRIPDSMWRLPRTTTTVDLHARTNIL